MTKFQKKFISWLPWLALVVSIAINIQQMKVKKNKDNIYFYTDEEREQIRKNHLRAQDCEMNYQHQIENL